MLGNKEDCKSIAQGELSLHEVLDYPSNKLHGSVMLSAVSRNNAGIDNEKVIGSLDYWFKLHTAGRINNKHMLNINFIASKLGEKSKIAVTMT